jgi:hypothetical protein
MEKTGKYFAAFGRAMDEKEVWKDRSLDFEGICRSIGADPASLDREVFDELGFRGQQVLDLYRGLFPNK